MTKSTKANKATANTTIQQEGTPMSTQETNRKIMEAAAIAQGMTADDIRAARMIEESGIEEVIELVKPLAGEVINKKIKAATIKKDAVTLYAGLTQGLNKAIITTKDQFTKDKLTAAKSSFIQKSSGVIEFMKTAGAAVLKFAWECLTFIWDHVGTVVKGTMNFGWESLGIMVKHTWAAGHEIAGSFDKNLIVPFRAGKSVTA